MEYRLPYSTHKLDQKLTFNASSCLLGEARVEESGVQGNQEENGSGNSNTAVLNQTEIDRFSFGDSC